MVVAVALAAPARAAAPLELIWNAPAECPTRDEVVAAVTRLVRKLPAEPLTAEVRIEHPHEHWLAELQASGGRRLLSGETCRALAETLVVILALSIDPGADTAAAAFPATEPAPTPSPARPPSAVAVPPAAAPPSHRTPPPAIERASFRTPLQLGGALRVFSEIGMLPGVTLGGAGALRWGNATALAELSAGALLPKTGTLERDATRGGRFSWFGGQLSGCLGFGVPEACAGIEVGRLSGDGIGVTLPEVRHALWLAPVLGVRAGLPLSSSSLFEAQLALAVPLFRAQFELEDLGPVHRPAAVSGRVGIGLRWR